MAFKREGMVALTPDRELLAYWCQGCEHIHQVNLGEGRPHWDWDGDVNAPTLSPSIREFWPATPSKSESTRCHHFLRAGMIEFLSDSAEHDLRGHHPLQPIPENYGGVE